ncbi:MAG: alpha/beta hydrolase [Micrococcales bacterium]|nr:alpha/beta hydrolase [Micrococcales bacterium]
MKTRTKIILGVIALVVLVGPFAVPVNTSGTLTNKEAAALSWDGESEFVELAGHEVHLVTAGSQQSDRLIVLLHGFGASSLTWKEVLEPLSSSGFVVAYDRAAFGFTERPTTIGEVNPYSSLGQLQVIDELVRKYGQGKEVVILGHSAGGALALGYALDHPEKVQKLILEAPAVYGSGGAPSWLNWVFDIPQLDHLGPLAVSSIASSGLQILDSSYYNKDLVTEQVVANYTAPLDVIGWERAFWEFNKAPRSLNLVERLDRLSVDTLIITGDTDEIVATADSVRLNGELPDSTLQIIVESGHLPNEEKPLEFVEAVISFLAK